MVINDPYELGVRRSSHNLPYLCQVARNINRRLLSLERTSHNCVITHQTFESFVLPTESQGQYVPGLRFGDPRVMAALSACGLFLVTPDGFTNAMLRQYVGALHDPGPKGYTSARMTYDLRRLRLKGIISRLPRSNRYVLTPQGRRIALFLTKTYARIVRPGVARLDPRLPASTTDPVARAFNRFETVLQEFLDDARLAA
jgi:hypothetical protein